jgi:hypothetical protein
VSHFRTPIRLTHCRNRQAGPTYFSVRPRIDRPSRRLRQNGEGASFLCTPDLAMRHPTTRMLGRLTEGNSNSRQRQLQSPRSTLTRVLLFFRPRASGAPVVRPRNLRRSFGRFGWRGLLGARSLDRSSLRRASSEGTRSERRCRSSGFCKRRISDLCKIGPLVY